MAKFLNKKEQVYDLQLTSYGRYLLSIGTFKPVYYTFMDDNVLYDGAYARLTESQNHIQGRIKEQRYIESTTLFTDVGEFQEHNPGSALNRFESVYSRERTIPRRDVGKTNAIIGDMRLEDNTSAIPAWKIVSLQGIISSSQYADFYNDVDIPQVNVDLNYHLQVQDSQYVYDPETSVDILGQTQTFIDNRVIKLIPDDAMFYIEEVNTQVLSENYDIEVFKIENPGGDQGKATGLLTFEVSMVRIGDTITISDDQQSLTFTYVAGATSSPVEIEFIGTSDLVKRTFVKIRDSGLNIDVAYADPTAVSHTQIELTARRAGPDYNKLIKVATTLNNAIIQDGMSGGQNSPDSLYRKYFQSKKPQIENGYMMSATPSNSEIERVGMQPGEILGSYSTSSVEYYFDVLVDSHVNQAKACTAAESFNKESYYVDFDFECDRKDNNSVFYDIYGTATEPEICHN